MKIKSVILAGIATILWIATPACSSETAPQSEAAPQKETSPSAEKKDAAIRWYGYDEGLALGKQEGKKILIHFYADWCIYCKKMEKEIFSKSEVADFINQNFVPIRLNSDTEQKLAEMYRVSSLPTTCFLESSGDTIQSLPGYMPKEMFMAYMKFVQTDSYRSMTFRKFMGVE